MATETIPADAPPVARTPMIHMPGADPAEAVSALVRQTVEFLVVLSLGIMLFRTFAAEAYIVPTGSMAPTLVGHHKDVNCGHCGFHYVMGIDDQGRAGRPVCPNCGTHGPDLAASAASNGDRLLVQKYLFDLRPPRRWEVAVFQSLSEPNQAYVKRVVGLPGEAIQLRGGDVYIDGKVARKDLAEVRATRLVVFDNNFVPADADRFPRWAFRRARQRSNAPSGWKAAGTGFVHEPSKVDGPSVDWIDYRHWDPDTGRYGPVRDVVAYNGGDVRAEDPVRDLMFEARVSARPDVPSLVVRVDSGSDVVLVTLPVESRAQPEVRYNGKLIAPENVRGSLVSSPAGAPRLQRLEVGVIDRRLLVAIDGALAFDPIDFDGPVGAGPGRFATPISVGVPYGGVTLSDLKIYRDVYYTGALSGGLRRPAGVDAPYLLKQGEFFVLGDNSPVSNDSRFWATGPVVRRRDFLGKPFLVHLPGRLAILQVFGRTICRIPDPREIRYIR
ncbi:MAG TPA: signal peptidase I [Isosphaeraceae bacterium]